MIFFLDNLLDQNLVFGVDDSGEPREEGEAREGDVGQALRLLVLRQLGRRRRISLDRTPGQGEPMELVEEDKVRCQFHRNFMSSFCACRFTMIFLAHGICGVEQRCPTVFSSSPHYYMNFNFYFLITTKTD